MHDTDDVHDRSAAMVVKWLTTPLAEHRKAKAAHDQVLIAHFAGSTWTDEEIAILRSLNQSDAALARTFDEA